MKYGKPQGESPLEENKLMKPEEVAHEILIAVIHRQRDLILTSNGKLVVFLNKFFPSFMDKKILQFVKKEGGLIFKKN
jgi:short-subunit dehydrogenase